MKFKDNIIDNCRRLNIKHRDGEELRIETKDMSCHDKPGVYVEIHNFDGNGSIAVTDLSRSKALKLAWAIIEELNPSAI